MGVWPEPGESMRFVCVLAVLRIVCAPNIPQSSWLFTKHVLAVQSINQWLTCMCPQDLPPLGLTLQLVGWVFRIDHEGTIQAT